MRKNVNDNNHDDISEETERKKKIKNNAKQISREFFGLCKSRSYEMPMCEHMRVCDSFCFASANPHDNIILSNIHRHTYKQTSESKHIRCDANQMK